MKHVQLVPMGMGVRVCVTAKMGLHVITLMVAVCAVMVCKTNLIITIQFHAMRVWMNTWVIVKDRSSHLVYPNICIT